MDAFNDSKSCFGTGKVPPDSWANGHAISIYNFEILVGDCAPTSSKQGKAYIFKKSNGTWETTPDVTFSPPTADAVDNLAFGWSVAMSENYLAISAPGPNTSTSDGKVYIYKKQMVFGQPHLIHQYRCLVVIEIRIVREHGVLM